MKAVKIEKEIEFSVSFLTKSEHFFMILNKFSRWSMIKNVCLKDFS